MSTDLTPLRAAIAALEAQRPLLGDALVDKAVAPLRAQLEARSAPPTAEPAQALRQVSILFLDVVGSTTLSRRLDPEAISAVMDDALARGTAIVQAHQGKVLRYAGDNILAAFGAHEAREDDPERAVHCGLALVALGRTLGAEVHAAHGHAGFDVRVGVHTGAVLLASGVDESGIHGIAVNVAARMEQSAPPGGLRISHDTYAHVRGLFDVQVQTPLMVSGFDMPVPCYDVVRAKPRSFRIGTRGIEGVATRMVGRDGELEDLQDAFKQLYARRELIAVTVVADAGMGKSRLLYEFEAWSEARPESFYVFRGRATPQTQGQPYGLLRDILAWRFQIADDDTLAAARAKVEQGIVPLFEPDEGAERAEGHAHLLGHLIGIDWRDSPHLRGILQDPRQIRNRAFHAAAQLFRRLSARDGDPVVLQLDDLHWADNESLDFLNYLAEVNRDVALLILGFARPTLFERRTEWKSTEGVHHRIDLAPLDKTGSRLLAGELLKKLPEVPAALRELVIGGAEGNPFYMEELVRMLIDQGAIRTGATPEDGWTLHAERLLATHVPPTLTGVLQARLDGLPPLEKRTLQDASVIGFVFWDQALFALESSARASLPQLVQRGLTLPRADAALDGLREFAFKHAVLHQVTYGTVLKKTRRELHGRLAHWLAAQTGLRARDFLGITADHFEQAGDKAQAAEFHARAAEHANGRFAHEATLLHVKRALDLLDAASPDAAQRWRLLDVRERSLELQGRREEQRADIEALEQLAETLDDDRRRAHAAWRRANWAMRRADWPAQAEAAERGIVLAERAGDAELGLQSLRLLAHASAVMGDGASGMALGQQALAQSQALGLRQMEASCLIALSIVAGLAGDFSANLAFNEQALAILRQIGDRRGEAVALSNLGAGRFNLGDYARARRDLEDSLPLCRANGDRAIEGAALGVLSDIALRSGDDAEALRLARSALELAVAVQARGNETEALRSLGEAELALGRHAAATRAFAQCRTLAGEIGDTGIAQLASTGLARVALAQGDTAAALAELSGLLEPAAGGADSSSVSDCRVELACHWVLAAAGDPRAGRWLRSAHERLQKQAGLISDAAQRRSYLDNIPEHKAIVSAWAGVAPA